MNEGTHWDSWPGAELVTVFASGESSVNEVRHWSIDCGYGVFACTESADGTRIHIDRADPRVLLSGPLVREALGAGPHHTLTHGKLTIIGENRKVIYRIGEYLPTVDCFKAEWPD